MERADLIISGVIGTVLLGVVLYFATTFQDQGRKQRTAVETFTSTEFTIQDIATRPRHNTPLDIEYVNDISFNTEDGTEVVISCFVRHSKVVRVQDNLDIKRMALIDQMFEGCDKIIEEFGRIDQNKTHP